MKTRPQISFRVTVERLENGKVVSSIFAEKEVEMAFDAGEGHLTLATMLADVIGWMGMQVGATGVATLAHTCRFCRSHGKIFQPFVKLGEAFETWCGTHDFEKCVTVNTTKKLNTDGQ